VPPQTTILAPKTRTLAVAGIAGPAVFTAGFLLLGFVRHGGYDPIAQQISDLTAGHYGGHSR
jgi:hypothetical protein